MKCKTCVTAVFLLFLTVLVSFSASNAQDIKSTLLIGIAEVNYTPAVGLDMAGNYRGNDYASRGIHDSLYARAIVAANEKGEKAALLTVDICYIPRETVEMMRAYIASKATIKPGNVMIMATHTHSGPVAELNAPILTEFLSKSAGAVI